MKVLGNQVANLSMGAAEQKSVSAETLSDISPADHITIPQRRADALVSEPTPYVRLIIDRGIVAKIANKIRIKWQVGFFFVR